jgi:hypothetical protein
MDRNVVLLVLDTVRKDYFDEHAPRLRAKSDLSFEQCRAASSWSTPSHASMMTGELPSVHGIHARNVDFTGLRTEDTFLADLPGYTATGASTNIFAGTPFGFDGAFDSFASMSRHALFPDGLDIDKFLSETDRDSSGRYVEFLRAVAGHEHPVKSVLNGVFLKLNDALEPLPLPRLYDYGTVTVSREVLDQVDDSEGPQFVFANYMEAHTPLQATRVYDGSLHDVPTDWSSNEVDIFDINNADDMAQFDEYFRNFRQLYGTAIDYLDRRLVDLVDEIHERTERETTVVVTADHGENLGTEADDHLLGHVSTLTDATLHVPLEVFNPPEGYEETVDDYVSHLDLPELLVALAEEEVADIRRDTVPAERIGLGLSHDPDNYEYWDRMIRCAYRGEEKFEWDSLGNRFRHQIDPERASWQERVETEVDVPSWALSPFPEDLESYDKRARGGGATTEEMDEHTRDQLEELGYL